MPGKAGATDLRTEVAKSNKRLDSLVNRNADGIMIIDRQGVIRYINPAAELLFGQRSEQMVGTHFDYEVFPGERSQIEVVRWDGLRATVEMRVVATDWEGEPAHVATLRDMSDRTRMETWLRAEAERRAHAETLHNTAILMAHYIRNAITPIMGWAELRTKGRFEDAEELTKVAMENGQKIAALIDALIEMSNNFEPNKEAYPDQAGLSITELDSQLRVRLGGAWGDPTEGLGHS